MNERKKAECGTKGCAVWNADCIGVYLQLCGGHDSHAGSGSGGEVRAGQSGECGRAVYSGAGRDSGSGAGENRAGGFYLWKYFQHGIRAGGILSMAVMAGAKRCGWFGTAGISILGGVFHNVGQLLSAALVTGTAGVFSYFPVLLAAGVVTGGVIGLLGGMVVERIKGYC